MFDKPLNNLTELLINLRQENNRLIGLFKHNVTTVCSNKVVVITISNLCFIIIVWERSSALFISTGVMNKSFSSYWLLHVALLLSVRMRYVVVQRRSLSRSSTVTAWAVCTNSSLARTRAAVRSSSAGTWTPTHATAIIGASPATWAVARYSPIAPRRNTIATNSWGRSMKPGRGTTGPSPLPCRGRWGGCRAPWPTWRGR